MNKKDELIKELKYMVINEFNSDLNIHCPNYERIADFILERDKKIVEPLINAYLNVDFPKLTLNGQLNRLYTGTVETLKNAGIED